MWVLDNTKQKF